MTGWIISFRCILCCHSCREIQRPLIEKVFTSGHYLHICLQSPDGKHRFRTLPMASLETCSEIPSFHNDGQVLSE